MTTVIIGPGGHFAHALLKEFSAVSRELVLVARNADRLSGVAAHAIELGYENVRTLACNVLAPGFPELLVASLAGLGPVRVVLFNVKVSPRGSLREIQTDDFSSALNANVSGSLAVLKTMARSDFPRVPGAAFINTGGGFKDAPDVSRLALSVSKAGLHNLTLATQLELRRYGLAVEPPSSNTVGRLPDLAILKDLVQSWVSGTVPRRGVVLKSHNTAVNNLLHFVSSSGSSSQRPYIDVEWSTPPIVTEVGYSSGDEGYVESYTPTLSAKFSDADGDQIRGVFSMTTETGTVVWQATSGYVASGAVASVSVPASAGLVDGIYAVRVQPSDGTLTGSTWQESVVVVQDTTPDVITPSNGPARSTPPLAEIHTVVEETFDEAVLNCMRSRGTAPSGRTAAQAFGFHDANGQFTPPTASLTPTKACLAGAVSYVDSAMANAPSGTTSFENIVREAGRSAKANEQTVQAETRQEQADPNSTSESAVQYCRDSSRVPSNSLHYVYGGTSPRRFKGMNEMQLLRQDQFFWYQRHRRPCFYNWFTNGCSAPLPALKYASFSLGCKRHDWAYRNVKRASILYNDSSIRGIHNKGVADTTQYVDLRQKCDSGDHGFPTDAYCKNMAWTYYYAVAKFGGEAYTGDPTAQFDTYKNWQYYYVVP